MMAAHPAFVVCCVMRVRAVWVEPCVVVMLPGVRPCGRSVVSAWCTAMVSRSARISGVALLGDVFLGVPTLEVGVASVELVSACVAPPGMSAKGFWGRKAWAA